MKFKSKEQEDRYWEIQWGISEADNNERKASNEQLSLLAEQNQIRAGLAQR